MSLKNILFLQAHAQSVLPINDMDKAILNVVGTTRMETLNMLLILCIQHITAHIFLFFYFFLKQAMTLTLSRA